MNNAKIQQIAKKTMDYIKSQINVGMSLKELRQIAENKMLALGATSFWHWGVSVHLSFRVKKQHCPYRGNTI